MRDDGVGVPRCGARVSRAVVAVLDCDAAHAGGARGLDVAQVVADVDATGGRQLELRRGGKQRRGMRLEMRCGVAAYDAGGRRPPGPPPAPGKTPRPVRYQSPGPKACPPPPDPPGPSPAEPPVQP